MPLPPFLSFSKKTLLVILGVIIAASIPSAYFYNRYRVLQQQLTNPTEFARSEARQLVDKVNKLMELPTDEEPTVAIVSDVSKLKDQAFFAKAKKGDKVLIYTNARLAILYDPQVNRILNVAPVNIGTPSADAAQQYTVALYNGTTVTGFTRTYEKTLLEKAPNVMVTQRDNAKRNDYDTSVLVDVLGSNASAAQTLSTTLGISLGYLPSEEATPAADFLIILGSDQK